LADDLFGHGVGFAGNELLVADREGVRGRRVEHGRPVGKIDPWIELDELAESVPPLGQRFLVFQHHHLAADAKVVRRGLAPGLVGFLAVGVEDLDHLVHRMKAGGDLGAASRRLARRRNADHGCPCRRVRLLDGTRNHAQIVEIPELAVMRDDRFGQRLVHDGDGLVVAGARLVDAEPDLGHLLRDAGRGADLQPPAGEVIEHADLLDQLPGRMIGRHHAHDAEPDAFGPQRDAGNQEVGRRRIGGAEVMLAEEDAVEAGGLRARPQIEIGVEMTLRHGGIEPLRQFRRRHEKLKNPGFDHSALPPTVREQRRSL